LNDRRQNGVVRQHLATVAGDIFGPKPVNLMNVLSSEIDLLRTHA
jgi:hypothetical protein